MGISNSFNNDDLSAKPRIVIASVLKPVDDPRALARMANSLSQANKYDLHIIGFKTKKVPTVEGITFHPIHDFPRLSFKRTLASIKFLRKLIQLKPQLVIVNTHEYLIVSSINRILFGTPTLYDVQENYFRNLWYTNTFPIGIKHLLAIYVRSKEWLTKPFVDHYLLAERGYDHELRFHRPNFTIIENKYAGLANNISKNKPSSTLQLIITGTLAEHYGLFEAIQFVKNISNHTPVHLTLVGYCPKKAVLNRLLSTINGDSRFSLVGGAEWVPHDTLIKYIHSSDAAIIAYPVHPATENCLPTKVFEYLALQIPFFITPHPYWLRYCEAYKAAIPVDFHQTDQSEAVKCLQKGVFYPKGAPKEVFWPSEGSKLLQVVHQILDSK